jgi:uncharacterized DUF497 family protein
MDAVKRQDHHDDEVGNQDRQIEGVPAVEPVEGAVAVVRVQIVAKPLRGQKEGRWRVQIVEKGEQNKTPRTVFRPRRFYAKRLIRFIPARKSRRLDERTYNVYTLSMDVLYQFGSLDFVWDVHKAAANIAKHGVRFEQACEVFFDPLVRVVDAGVADAARDGLLGQTNNGSLLFVVHIEIENDSIRIISARHATAMERKNYEDYA